MSDDKAKTERRTYVVLENVELAVRDEDGNPTAETTRAFVEVHRVQARNAKDALAQTAKIVYPDLDPAASTTLVAVPERNFRPARVAVATHHTLTVGLAA